jgi:hypothetical protein
MTDLAEGTVSEEELEQGFLQALLCRNNQGVAKTGNSSVCHTTTEPSGLAQTSKVSVQYNLYLY